jgi:hypothetical protein
LALSAGAITATVLIEVRAQAPANPPAFHLSFGELMTVAIQARHLKLGLAGQDRNWAYAAYELRELQSAFQRVADAVPVYRSTDMAALIKATMAAPLADLSDAIKKHDGGKFDEAYEQLTATCNACHQSTNHEMVVIQVPRASSYPNQDFRRQNN